MGIGQYMGVANEKKPPSRISRKLKQLARKAAQSEKNVAWFVPPVRLGPAGDLLLKHAQIA